MKLLWKNLTKIAVSGSRRFEEPDLATQYMDNYIRNNFDSIDDVVLITGNAIGVDEAMQTYCMRNGIKNLIINARWLELAPPAGKNPAGVIRNRHMVDLAQEFFAFWDGHSKGTLNAIKHAQAKGIECIILDRVSIRKELGLAPPPVYRIPKHVKNSEVHRIRQYAADAELVKTFKSATKKKKKIKENFFL